jgi:hypothetical protein
MHLVGYLYDEMTLFQKSGNIKKWKYFRCSSLQKVPRNPGLSDDSKCPSYTVLPTQFSHFFCVAVRSVALVCRRSVAGSAGSNPADGMDVRLLCLLCVV